MAATVISCIALAIAIVVIFLAWALVQRNREALLADVRKAVKEASQKFDLQRVQMKVSQDNHDEAVESYRKMRERAQAHFLTADSDADLADRRLSELERYTKRTLEHLAMTGAKPLILRGGLYVQQVPMLDIVLELADKFLMTLGADLMYRQDDGPDGSMFYLRWPMDTSPRSLLDSLTRAAHYSCDTTGSAGPGSTDTDPGSTDPGSTDPGSTDPGSTDPGSTSSDIAPLPGITDLRAVLEALQDGGLGVLYLGPLILLRTETCIQAGFLQPSFERLTEPQKKNAVNGTGRNLMEELGVAVFLEFRR